MFRSRTKDSDCSASFADSEPISTSCLREKKLILWPFVRRKRTPNRTFAIPELDHKNFQVGNWRLEISSSERFRNLQPQICNYFRISLKAPSAQGQHPGKERRSTRSEATRRQSAGVLAWPAGQ